MTLIEYSELTKRFYFIPAKGVKIDITDDIKEIIAAQALQIAGDAWDAGQARLMYEASCEEFEPDRKSYLSNLKKKLEA